MSLSAVPASCVVYTPPKLAAAMVATLGDTPDAKWLEPCVGGGVFLQALSQQGVQRSRICAVDLDPVSRANDRLAKTYRGQEFLSWSLATTKQFQRIVANPPYVALNRVHNSIRETALRVVSPNGVPVTARANCWSAFLTASLRILAPGGHLGFLLPAAWDYANYADSLRQEIPLLFDEVHIHRSHLPLFRQVQEGSIVLLAKDYQPVGQHRRPGRVSRFEHHSITELLKVLQSTVPRSTKQSIGVTNIRITSRQPFTTPKGSSDPRGAVRSAQKVRLSDILQIRLGGVTGDSRYFLMSESERLGHGLPRSSMRPVLSRAQHLTSGEATRIHWNELLNRGERVWLFDPPISSITDAHVRKYLNLKVEQGGCRRDRYKIRLRDPWYRVPLPSMIDGFMSGMSKHGPWVVFNQMPHLAATNTLYTIAFPSIDSLDEQAAWAMWLITTDASLQLRDIERRYADGLVKYEPGDIGRLLVSAPVTINGAYKAYQKAVSELIAGNIEGARSIANKWFR